MLLLCSRSLLLRLSLQLSLNRHLLLLRGKAREGNSSLTGGSGSDSDSGSSSESDDEIRSELESSAGPNVPSESSPDLLSRENLSVALGVQANREQDSPKPGAVLPSKGDQNVNEPTSNDSTNKEQQIPKQKRTLKSLKDFRLEPIFFSWYRYDNKSIFREILTEFGIKNNVDRFVKILYAAAEIIRYLDQGDTAFINRLNRFHYEYETQPTVVQFDDYLYRWAMKVWPRPLDKIHEYTQSKYA